MRTGAVRPQWDVARDSAVEIFLIRAGMLRAGLAMGAFVR